MTVKKLGVERLEDRSVPATFGIPWADRHLTLSFAPDGTSVSGSGSNLFDSLNQVRSEQEWQWEILRAYQTWARYTNLSVAVAPDSGAAIGTPGRWQGDERFGDIRLSGVNLNSNVLAIGTPADPGLAGTRAGDVILNTGYRFDGSPYDLYSVMLHEAGHSLGLGNSANPNAVMFTQYSGVRAGLHSSDVAAVRGLYGARVADQFEGANGNNTSGRATDLGGVPARSVIQLAFGDLTTAADRDVYSFLTVGPDGADNQNVTVKIQSAGLSLVNARITVFYLENGVEQEVGNATMDKDGFTGGEAAVTFDANDDLGPRRYYVRVEKADGTAFDVGQYALGVSFQDQGDDDFSQEDLLTVQYGPRIVLLNADGNKNDTRGTATVLPPTSVSTALPNSRYEVLASLSSAADSDFYRVIAPAGTGPRVLTVNTQAMSGLLSAPAIELYNANGGLIPADVLANDNGLYTVQAAGLTAGATYFIRVVGGTGSYRLTADFTTVATDVRTFAAGQIPAGVSSVTDTLYIGRAQVMTFLVSAEASAPVGSGVRLSVRDGNGNVVYSRYAAAGETVSGPGVLLRPGEYTVEIEAVRPVGYTGPVSVIVRGNKLDDPVGAQKQDPTFKPTYVDPNNDSQFIYPDGTITIDPFYWLTLLLA